MIQAFVEKLESFFTLFYKIISFIGKVAEWSNASVLKTDVASQLPRVRISPFPKRQINIKFEKKMETEFYFLKKKWKQSFIEPSVPKLLLCFFVFFRTLFA